MRTYKIRFSDFRVKSKLFILTSIMIACLILMAVATNLLLKASKSITILVNEEKVFVEYFDSGIEMFYKYQLSENHEDLNRAYLYFNNANRMTFSFAKIDSLMATMSQDEWVPYYFDIFKEGFNNNIKMAKFMAGQINIFGKLNNKKTKEIQKIAWDGYLLGEKTISLIKSYNNNPSNEKLIILQAEFEKIHTLSKTFSNEIYSLNEYVTKTLVFLLIFLVIVLGIVATIFGIRISHSISDPINSLADNFKQIATGNLKSSINIKSKNEIGELSKAFSKIQLGLQDIISYSKKVAKGDYSAKLKPKSDKDELTLALNQMAAKLEEARTYTDKENWIQKGISGLDDQMRGNSTVKKMSEKIIIYLSNFLEIEMGAVYVFDEVLNHLEFTGSIGLTTTDIQEKIQLGESLIGKSALKNSIQIINTKDKHKRTFSAVGDINPEKLYFVPIYNNDQIQGVIELAPINELSELKIEFLNLISQRIAINIGAAVGRFRHNELLDKTLEQADILQSREEELSKNFNELQNTQKHLEKESLARKKQEEEANNARDFLQTIIDALPDPIFVKEKKNHNFVILNQALCDYNGINRSDILGKNDHDMFPKEEADIFFNDEEKLFESKDFFEKEEKATRHGEITHTSTKKRIIQTKDGGEFLVGVNHDITIRKTLELEVQERNKKLQAQQEKLTLANSELTQQQEELKSTNEELKSQEEELRVANEEMEVQTKILTESEKSLQVQQEELRVANEELEFKSNQLELQKQEITNKNRSLIITQGELKQKAKELELASQYKSEFLANMSHELRTPLNSLLILSKLLGNNKEGNLNNSQIKSANIIYKSGKDLLDLINEILDLSKIEAGKMTYEFMEMATDDLKTEITQGFSPIAENKDLSLKINIAKNLPKTIYTDRQRLMQIIKNLLSNAFKFTQAGSIKVNMGLPKASTLFVNDTLNPENTYYIAVEDSGVGIPKNKVDEIFDAFQQADGSISRKFGGTGLGLSISKQLTRVLGGEIHVDSKEGIGSIFTVYLPLDRELVGVENNDNDGKKENSDHSKKLITPKNLATNFHIQEKTPIKIPVFIDDDRNSELNRIMVLIIHPEKTKAQKLLDLCHNKKFNAVVGINIDDGIKLAMHHTPKAIIISSKLNNQEELKKLENNPFTNRLPIHLVTRIEDGSLKNLDELKTPGSEEFHNITKSTGTKLSTEYNQVLVVEDDPATRLSIHMLFESEDIIIHEAKTGQQAYDLLSTKTFDCIILDLGLPDFSGYELLKRLNSENIPIPNVIIHTARELTKQELRDLHKYSDSIVIKGVKSDERLMDEVSLFLHQVANTLPKESYPPVQDSDNLGYKGKKVLVVDDDIRNIFALAQILENKEIEILEAENGEIAIDVLKNNTDIDLILMDIMMPVMDGYEAMKIIKKTKGINNIPIITLTAKAMKEDYQKAIDSGANDYISKPVDVDKLFELLKIWLFK